MPRSKPVDYPQVHRPSTQPPMGLAPPQHNFEPDNRFSWQDTFSSGVSSNTERQLEVGSRDRPDRQSIIPPLPILPEHLNNTLVGSHISYGQAALISEKNAPSLSHAQVESQFEEQSRQKSQFRPDVPRNLQQAQPGQRLQHHGSTPSYEASQAAYSQALLDQAKVLEQSARPANHADPQNQLATAPQNPCVHVYDQQLSQEEKPLKSSMHMAEPKPVHFGPDANPLSPTSPRLAISPTHTNTTNIQTFPPPRTTDMHFGQPILSQPTPSTKGGTWHHSLGSCAEPTTCLSSLLCPCVVYGRTQYRLSLKSAKKDPTNMLGYSNLNASCVAWGLLCGINVLLTAIQHTRIRKTYEMEKYLGAGNIVGDFGKSLCCCCCVLAQDEKEMKLREGGGGATLKAAAGGLGYQRAEEMTFAPPLR